MNKSTQSLASSLVGGSIDFSFKKKMEGATSIDENIEVEKKRIAKGIDAAFEAGGNLCVTLLAEMMSFYSKQLYYMAVRGTFALRRYRPFVLEYLDKSIDERQEHLLKLLKEKSKFRDTIIEAVRYFLTTYKGRFPAFKKYLSREEYLIVRAL